jgi:outer membrane protein TolC
LSRDLAEINRKAVRNTFLPEVSASFSYGLGGMGNGSSLVGDYDFNSAAVGITVNIPIFTGGAHLARINAARLEQERSNIALLQREKSIETELLELRLRLDEARAHHTSAYRTVETARRAVTLAETAYVNGQATYLTVADAQ